MLVYEKNDRLKYMRNIDIESLDELDTQLTQNQAAIVFFSGSSCNVCTVLKPKVIELINTSFPNMQFISVDCDKSPEVAGQNSVLSIPTVIVYFDGKEGLRFTRSFSIGELEANIKRTYDLMFGE